MKLLAFDTSASACSVALLNGEKITALHHVAPMQQASLILSMLQQILDTAGVSLQALDMIAYGCGPGSFTGIRLASAVAQGLGFAYSLPIMPISSLAASAQAAFMAHQYKWPQLLVAVDARMGDVYWAAYAKHLSSDHVTLIGQEHLYKPESVIIPTSSGLDPSHWYGIGDAWKQYKSPMTLALAIEPCAYSIEQQPTAEAILTLAKAKLVRGERGVQATDAIPVYLR